MILINLYGGPGSGKSTGAAYIFSKLKMAGINAELITEFAKDKVWEESKEVFNNQAYVFGKQYFRISRCAKKVDVIVTDSPLLLSIIYNKDPVLGEDFNKVVKNVYHSFNNRNFFLNRVKSYNPIGRFQTEEQSNEISTSIFNLLKSNNIKFDVEEGNFDGYDNIVNQILKEFFKEENE